MRSLFFALAICNIQFLQAQDLKLWYNKPAVKWTEALPVGNGHIGGIIFGGVEKADYNKGGQLARKMQGLYTESYMPLGDITLSQDFAGQVLTAYYRDLNLQTAVATTRFTINGIEYIRESFVSAPANTMVIRLSASKKGALNTDISANSLLHFSAKASGNLEAEPLMDSSFDTNMKIIEKKDGWYLSLSEKAEWRNKVSRNLITTAFLGKAAVSGCAYENADGSPLIVNRDYIGKKRNEKSPFPGPFEMPVNGEIKVWSK